MSARTPRVLGPAEPSPYPRPRVSSCNCGAVTHPLAAELDAELRELGKPGRPDGLTISALAVRYGIGREILCVHRRHHLGLPPLPRGRAAYRVPTTARGKPKPPPAPLPPVRTEQRPLPPSPEGQFAQLVRTVGTLVSIGQYRDQRTVAALAARHGVPESEVVRAHRRAVQSIRDAKGGIREQVELSVGVLTQIRDQERRVAEDYTGIADRIVAASVPNAQTGAPAQRQASQDELDRARTARSIAAQAHDVAVACQRQIDQNTVHRKTAPLVQVSFSANPDFGKAQEALVLLLCAVVGPEREQEARERVARGLQVLEDAGENLDSPEFLEYLAELRADSGALVAEAVAAE